MSGLVNASFSLPEWQAVKMIFFGPCRYTAKKSSCMCDNMNCYQIEWNIKIITQNIQTLFTAQQIQKVKVGMDKPEDD